MAAILRAMGAEPERTARSDAARDVPTEPLFTGGAHNAPMPGHAGSARAPRVELLAADRVVVDAGKDALAAVQMFLDDRKSARGALPEPARRDSASADAQAAQLRAGDAASFAARAAQDLGLDATVPVAAVAPTQVADQVASWVTQNIREAELRVDGANGERVEVRIALEGNEARVEFGCDAEQMRELLQDAAQELEQRLRQEGLVLADVWVGAGFQPRSGQPDARQQGQTAPEARATPAQAGTVRGADASDGAAAALAAPRAVRTALGALDLFV